MEKEIKKSEQQNQTLQKYFQRVYREDDKLYLSHYTGENLDYKTIVKQADRLNDFFPRLTMGYFERFRERLLEISHKFTNKKLIDAVNNVIDTYEYEFPPFAKIVKYDKRSRLYTRDEILKIQNEDDINIWDKVESKKINDQIFYIKKLNYGISN